MPELPEVETVVRDLRPRVVGQTLASVNAGPTPLRRPWQAAWSERVRGAAVTAIDRRGKWILFTLDRPERLLVHLGMTGQFTTADADVPAPDHLHLWFGLSGSGRQLRLRDPRRFGSADVFDSQADLDVFLNDRLGPEPFALQSEAFRTSLAGTRRPVKAVLLDQAVVAGVGNIYADEALHRAGLHPTLRADTLTAEQAEGLRRAVVAVLTVAIERRGSTIRDYVGGSGLAGGFQREFKVYGLDGEPCQGCAATLQLVRVAGRSSHYCPACQPAGGT